MNASIECACLILFYYVHRSSHIVYLCGICGYSICCVHIHTSTHQRIMSARKLYFIVHFECRSNRNRAYVSMCTIVFCVFIWCDAIGSFRLHDQCISSHAFKQLADTKRAIRVTICVCVIESTSLRRPNAITLYFNRLHLSHRLVSKQNNEKLKKKKLFKLKYVVRIAHITLCSLGRAVHCTHSRFRKY